MRSITPSSPSLPSSGKSLPTPTRGPRVFANLRLFFFSTLADWECRITQIYRDARSQGQAVIDVRLLPELVARRAARHRRHLPLGLLLPVPPRAHRSLHRRLVGPGRSEYLQQLVQHWQVVPRGGHCHWLDHSTL